jgi:hypothetical protein
MVTVRAVGVGRELLAGAGLVVAGLVVAGVVVAGVEVVAAGPLVGWAERAVDVQAANTSRLDAAATSPVIGPNPWVRRTARTVLIR